MERASFPLLYTDDDGQHYVLRNEDETRLRVEFADDWDPAYLCRDGAGRRIRLIVWNLDLLVAQVVPDDFERDDLRIHGTRDGSIVETWNGTALRLISPAAGSHGESAQPEQWTAPLKTSTLQLSRNGGTTIMEFHRRWMLLRTGDKHFA